MSDPHRGPSLGLRHVPGLGGPLRPPPDDPELAARIRTEIARSGPMTFARFMRLALYDPEGGYYAVGAGGPGREAGDFLTAPEGHPIFGWTLARQLEETWGRLGRPDPFVIREHGAGRGALAVGILEGLRRSGSDLLGAVRYEPVDIAVERLDRLRERCADAGFADRVAAATDGPVVGAILANELLDALPTHAVEGGPDGRPLERFVVIGPSEELRFAAAEPSTPALADRLAAAGVTLRPGQPAEVCLALDDWAAAVGASLARGIVIVIDYGYPAERLYDPATGSTLRAYTRHHVHADPFVSIGRQDLTAHVDLDAVGRAMAAAGLDHLGRTTQAEFLASLGIGDLLAALAEGSTDALPAYLEARAAVVRVLDPAATGRFVVLLHGRGLPAEPPLRGLSLRLDRRPAARGGWGIRPTD